MNKMIMTALAAAFAFAPIAAGAAELSGQVAAWDAASRALTLDSGAFCRLADDISIDGLVVGARVTVDYEGEGENAVCSDVTIN